MASKHNSKAFLGILGTQYFVLPFAITTGILVARILGPEDRGIYGFALLISNLISPLALLGIQTSVTYFIASKEFKSEDIFYTIIIIGVVIGLLCSAGLYGFWYYSLFGQTGNLLTLKQILICIAFIPCTTIYYLLSRIVRAEGWYKYVNGLEIIYTLCTIVYLLFFVLFLKWAVDGAVLAVGLIQLTLLTVSLIIILKHLKPRKIISSDFISAALKYGVKSWFGTVATLANSKLDHLLVSGFTGASNYAFYSVAVSLASLIEKIPLALSPVLFNKIAEQKDELSKVLITEQSHRILYPIIYILGLGLIIVGPILVPILYGEAYRGAILPFLIFTPVVLLYTTTRIIIYFFTSSKKVIVSSYIQIICLIIAVPCYFYFASNFGAVGAAIANVIVSIVGLITALTFYLIQKNTSLKGLFIISRNDYLWILAQIKKVKTSKV